MESLLEAGADPDEGAMNGATPLLFACEREKFSENAPVVTPLHLACHKGTEAIVKAAPLHLACCAQMPVVAALLEADVDTEKRTVYAARRHCTLLACLGTRGL